jgi:hypothetical protein
MKTIRSNELRELIINNPEKRFLIMDDDHDMMVTWAINEIKIPKEQRIKIEPFGATVIGLTCVERTCMEGEEVSHHYDWTIDDYREDAKFILFDKEEAVDMANAMLSIFKTFSVKVESEE